MELFGDPAAMRAWSQVRRAAGTTIALVPTMGALHDGHRALVAEARHRATAVIVSIFVNPIQFDRASDFDRYPRAIDDDLATCREAGRRCGVCARRGHDVPTRVSDEGRARIIGRHARRRDAPGHFEGVTTIVTKLLAATVPDVAIFGQKDYQQLAIVRRMVADLDLGVEIVAVPTAREPDGLARSSRNVRLSAGDRAAAVAISTALGAAAAAYADGERDGDRLRATAIEYIEREPRAKAEYVAVVDASTLEPLATVDRPAVILTAVWFGDVRLIDNQLLG